MNPKFKTRRTEPCVLLADSDMARLKHLRRWIETHRIHVIESTTAAETQDIIEDVCRLEARLDGLLIGHRLSDALGHRVVMDFCREFPNASVIFLLDEPDLGSEIWARAHGIQVVNEASLWPGMKRWVAALKKRAPVRPRRVSSVALK